MGEVGQTSEALGSKHLLVEGEGRGKKLEKYLLFWQNLCKSFNMVFRL